MRGYVHRSMVSRERACSGRVSQDYVGMSVVALASSSARRLWGFLAMHRHGMELRGDAPRAIESQRLCEIAGP